MTATTRRWLARASFALMLAAVVLVLAVAGWRSLALVAFAVIGVCAVLAGGYWFLANRGVLRWLALVLVVAAPVLILVAFALHQPGVGRRGGRGADGGRGRDRAGRAEHRRPGRGHARRPGGPPAAAVPDHEPEVGRREGHQVRAAGQGARRWAPRWRCWRARGPWTWPPWPARRWPMAPTCSGWPAGTGPRRWWPGSPPSTTCRSW